MQYLQCR